MYILFFFVAFLSSHRLPDCTFSTYIFFTFTTDFVNLIVFAIAKTFLTWHVFHSCKPVLIFVTGFAVSSLPNSFWYSVASSSSNWNKNSCLGIPSSVVSLYKIHAFISIKRKSHHTEFGAVTGCVYRHHFFSTIYELN